MKESEIRRGKRGGKSEKKKHTFDNDIGNNESERERKKTTTLWPVFYLERKRKPERSFFCVCFTSNQCHFEAHSLPLE